MKRFVNKGMDTFPMEHDSTDYGKQSVPAPGPVGTAKVPMSPARGPIGPARVKQYIP
ncbi:MAG: hypothetical protein LIP08_11610 [Bacteroides sp.]|nr:hypothetical protein [Bacteroides sp.]